MEGVFFLEFQVWFGGDNGEGEGSGVKVQVEEAAMGVEVQVKENWQGSGLQVVQKLSWGHSLRNLFSAQ